MSELLKLAEAYYKVAEDVLRKAAYFQHMGETLNAAADEMCEQNIRDQSPKPEPVTPSQQSVGG